MLPFYIIICYYTNLMWFLNYCRLMNLTWFLTLQINEFVKLGGDQLVPYYADILGAILPCISDKEEKIIVVSCFFHLFCT